MSFGNFLKVAKTICLGQRYVQPLNYSDLVTA